MNLARIIPLALAAGLVGGTAAAQTPSVAAQPALGGQAFAVGPRAGVHEPTTLFSLGGLPAVVWTPVAPPYDVAANRNLAGNPLP